MVTPDPFHAKLGKKSTWTQMSPGKRKDKPLKSISQALKCKLLSLVGSPLYTRHSPENLWACNLGMHPIFVRFPMGVLINYSKMSCCCWDFLYATLPLWYSRAHVGKGWPFRQHLPFALPRWLYPQVSVNCATSKDRQAENKICWSLKGTVISRSGQASLCAACMCTLSTRTL